MTARKVVPGIRLSEDEFDDWLSQGTDDDLLFFARRLRRAWAGRIDEADAQGDGARVNALCHYARAVFAPDVRW